MKIVIILIIIGLIIGSMFNPLLKIYLQKLITENYHLRELRKLPDKWFWADRLYPVLYGWDYSFYTERGVCVQDR